MRNSISRTMSVPVLGTAWFLLAASSGCQSVERLGLVQLLTQIDRQRMTPIPHVLRQADHDAWKSLRAEARGSLSLGPSAKRSVFSLAAYQPSADSVEGDDETSPEQTSLERGPLPSFKETLLRDLQRWPGDLWRETKDVYTDPGNIVILMGAGGAAVALHQHADDANANFFADENHFGNETRDLLSFVGSPGTHFAIAGLWYTVGIGVQDDKTYEVGRTLIDALVINGVSTTFLKVVSGREGPNGEWGAFPSGHMSSTVTLAAVMYEAYGPWVGVPLYGLSGLVAIERLDDEEHYLSDVVFGAAMGWVIGHTVATGRRPQLLGGEIVPYMDPENQVSGLAWVKGF